jgi:hypothetical protein
LKCDLQPRRGEKLPQFESQPTSATETENKEHLQVRPKQDIRIIKTWRMRWVGHVAQMGEKRDVYRLLVRKPEGKRPLGRPSRRWVNNIRMDLGEGVMWTGLVWLRIETGGELL